MRERRVLFFGACHGCTGIQNLSVRHWYLFSCFKNQKQLCRFHFWNISSIMNFLSQVRLIFPACCNLPSLKRQPVPLWNLCLVCRLSGSRSAALLCWRSQEIDLYAGTPVSTWIWNRQIPKHTYIYIHIYIYIWSRVPCCYPPPPQMVWVPGPRPERCTIYTSQIAQLSGPFEDFSWCGVYGLAVRQHWKQCCTPK